MQCFIVFKVRIITDIKQALLLHETQRTIVYRRVQI